MDSILSMSIKTSVLNVGKLQGEMLTLLACLSRMLSLMTVRQTCVFVLHFLRTLLLESDIDVYVRVGLSNIFCVPSHFQTLVYSGGQQKTSNLYKSLYDNINILVP